MVFLCIFFLGRTNTQCNKVAEWSPIFLLYRAFQGHTYNLQLKDISLDSIILWNYGISVFKKIQRKNFIENYGLFINPSFMGHLHPLWGSKLKWLGQRILKCVTAHNLKSDLNSSSDYSHSWFSSGRDHILFWGLDPHLGPMKCFNSLVCYCPH